MNFSQAVNATVDFWQDYLQSYTYALLVVLAFYILSRLVSKYLVNLLLKFTTKTGTKYDTKFVLAFKKPVAWILISIGFYIAGLYLLETPAYLEFLNRLFRSAIIIFLTYGLYNMMDSSSGVLVKLANNYDLDKMFLSLLSKTIRVVIFAISFTILVQEWGYDITGFIAGLGLGGLAFALAAQDTAANLFGGFVILVEKPFTIGDWIVGANVEGTVEDITFRSTKVRTFAQALVTVPNSSLAKDPVTNWTRMGRRQISFTLGVPYNTPRAKLEVCVNRIRHLVENNPEIHPATIFVNFQGFGTDHLEIFVYCFTVTTVWGDWLKARENMLYRIMDILEQEGVEVAVPARSLYIEQGGKKADILQQSVQEDNEGE